MGALLRPDPLNKETMVARETRILEQTRSKLNNPLEVEDVAVSDDQRPIDTATEKRITRRLDLHILPLVFFMWYAIPNLTDRNNFSSAS